MQRGNYHMRKCFINYGAPCKCCCLPLLLRLLSLLVIWPLVGSLLGFCQDPLSLLSECFHYGPRLLFLTGLIPGAGGRQQKRAGFPLMPFMTPTLAFYKYVKTDEGTDNTESHRTNQWCLRLLGGRVSSALPAAGEAFPPELPAWISRLPACLSWPTASYLIPENLSINRGVTRPADKGTHIWTTKELNRSPRCDCGIYPRNQESVK